MAQYGVYLLMTPDFWIKSGLCFVFYYGLQKACAVIFPHFSKTFKHLSVVERIDWCNKICSLVHATLTTFMVTYYILNTNHEETHPIYRFRDPNDHTLMDVVLYNSIAYVFYDLWFLIENYPNFFDYTIVGHHILMSVGLISNAYTKYSPFLTALLLFSELSTPFLNMRWFFFKRNLTNRKRYLVNGLLLWLSFFVGRVLTIPFCLYVHYNSLHKYGALMSFTEYYMYPLMSIFLCVVNVYWFSLLTKKVIRALLSSNKTKTK